MMNDRLSIQGSPGNDLQARIVASARNRFRQFGYAKTSMHEIAEDCGMSAANIYRYYDGKLALGVAVAAAEQAALFAKCDLAVGRTRGTCVAALTALFHTAIDASRRQITQAPLLFELNLIVTSETPDFRRQFLSQVEQRIAAILASDCGGGATTPDGLEVRTRTILLACAPFILPWMMLNEPFGDPRPQVGPLIRCLVSGMAAELPAAKADFGKREPAAIADRPPLALQPSNDLTR